MTKIQEFNDFAVDLKQSILWQYNEATNLLSLINQKQQWYDQYQSAFWAVWYDVVFNLTTSDRFGSAIWAIILNLPLLVSDEPISLQDTWGFNAYDPTYPDLLNNYVNFDNGNFNPYNSNLNLTIEQERWMLRLRYFQLTTLTNIAGMTGTDYSEIYSINWFLNYLCNDNDIGYSGTIYVIDNLDMTITYHLTASDFPGTLLNVLIKYDVFPRPAGVAVSFTADT